LLNYSPFAICNLIITVVSVTIAFRRYTKDRAKDATEQQKLREETIEKDATRHAENKTKIDSLINFHRDQVILNHQRDQQVSELKEQTSLLNTQTEVLKSLYQTVVTRVDRIERKQDGDV
jgi:vacuolar-type H+-ATPase subunit E/Vma4